MRRDRYYIATDDGLIVWAPSTGDGGQHTVVNLEGRSVSSVTLCGDTVLAATTDGVFCSHDGGVRWTEACVGLTIRHVRWMGTHPGVRGLLFAGTEPVGIFRSEDAGTTWRACPEVAELRDRFGWFLPYSPEAGCVRGFAFHGERVYAAVEVGGVLRSDDAGCTWGMAAGSDGRPVFETPPASMVYADVHSVAGHPESPELVFAATAGGLYRSTDGGETWSVSHAGSYCRAVWVDPNDPAHLVLGPADSVSKKNGRIEESMDHGTHWAGMSEGLTLPWPDTMVERFVQIGDELFAITNDGQAFVSSLEPLHWQRVLPAVSGIRAITAL